jgi:uncharacterized protein (DUF433 family)
MAPNDAPRPSKGAAPQRNGRIQKTPGVCGGDACIGTTRIAVWMLVEGRRAGMSDERLLEAHPTLTQADLDAAWDYYAHHREEIDEAIRENEDA